MDRNCSSRPADHRRNRGIYPLPEHAEYDGRKYGTDTFTDILKIPITDDPFMKLILLREIKQESSYDFFYIILAMQ